MGRLGEGQKRAEFEKAVWQRTESRDGGLVCLGRETVDGQQRGHATWRRALQIPDSLVNATDNSDHLTQGRRHGLPKSIFSTRKWKKLHFSGYCEN